MTEPWRKDQVFDDLADTISSDRLIVFTGAGMSSGLIRDDGKKIGGWKDLLVEVTKELKPGKSAQRDLDTLLAGSSSGPELIEAATILEEVNSTKFNRLVRRKLTPAKRQSKSVNQEHNRRHTAVLKLFPRGIVTLNIDRQHVKYINKLPATRRNSWSIIDPTMSSGECKIRDWLRDQHQKRFLLEAHGSLDKNSKIVFSHHSYRDLIKKNPTYDALLDLLFSSYRFLFLGFGLTDLDFDQFLGETALRFGMSPQPHIIVRKSKRSTTDDRQTVHYRRRFGIHFLDVDTYDDVWKVVEAAAGHCGKGTQLSKIIKDCVSKTVLIRKRGHLELASLGVAGQSLALSVLKQRISGLLPNHDTHTLSEYLYCLKYLASRSTDTLAVEAKAILFDVLRQSNNTELVAHAVTALEAYLIEDDLSELEAIAHDVCKRKLSVPKNFPDKDDRCPVFLEAAILRLRAKYLKFPKRKPLLKHAV